MYDEMQKYRDQEPFAPQWSNNLKTFGFADCQSLLCSIDAKPTCADSIHMAEIIMARVDRGPVRLQTTWNAATDEEREWLLRGVRGE